MYIQLLYTHSFTYVRLYRYCPSAVSSAPYMGTAGVGSVLGLKLEGLASACVVSLFFFAWGGGGGVGVSKHVPDTPLSPPSPPLPQPTNQHQHVSDKSYISSSLAVYKHIQHHSLSQKRRRYDKTTWLYIINKPSVYIQTSWFATTST